MDRNVHIIPTGIDIERFYKENQDTKKISEIKKHYGIEKGDFVILYVGRLAKEKNIDFLLDAQRSLVKKNKHYKLMIVGSGPDLEKYKAYTAKHKIANNVIFTGPIPWENVPYYYNLSTVFVTASKTETQGLTVVEALAASKPVVCIDDPAFVSTIIDDLNGKIFKTKRQYCHSIYKLQEEPAVYKRLANQALISSEVHSSKYFAERVLDVYKVAINKKGKKGFFHRIFKGE